MNIHPTAIVSADARLGDNVFIGPYVVIEPDTHIGNCEIRAHAVVKRFTTIGENCTVHEGVVLGGEPQAIGYADCVSYLRIGSNNRIREGVTIHRGTQPESETAVGSGCFIMANTHVAHNCHVGDGVILANNVALAGHVDIGNQAFLSGGGRGPPVLSRRPACDDWGKLKNSTGLFAFLHNRRRTRSRSWCKQCWSSTGRNYFHRNP